MREGIPYSACIRRFLPMKMSCSQKHASDFIGSGADTDIGTGAIAGFGSGFASHIELTEKVVPKLRRMSDDLHGSDAGAVTAEFAMVLPAVIIMVALLLSVTRAVSVSMTCQDAAASAARQLILTKSEADVQRIAQSVAGPGASVSVARVGGNVTVVAQCPILPDSLRILPAKVTGKATGIEQ